MMASTAAARDSDERRCANDSLLFTLFTSTSTCHALYLRALNIPDSLLSDLSRLADQYAPGPGVVFDFSSLLY